MHVHNTEPCTPLNAIRVCESASSVVFATQNATVHHCIVDLSPMKVVVSHHALQTLPDGYLANAWGVTTMAILWVPRSDNHCGSLGYLQHTGYCFEN